MEQAVVLNGVKARIRDAAIPGFQDVTIVAAELGNLAGLYGARANVVSKLK